MVGPMSYVVMDMALWQALSAPLQQPDRGRVRLLLISGFLLLVLSFLIAFQQSYAQSQCGHQRCIDPLLIFIASIFLIVGALVLLVGVTLFIRVKLEENLKNSEN